MKYMRLSKTIYSIAMCSIADFSGEEFFLIGKSFISAETVQEEAVD